MLRREEIQYHIEHVLHLQATRRKQHAHQYDASPYPFYMKLDALRPLVVHPAWKDDLLQHPINGVCLGNLYHNSALNKFPRLSGRDRSPCGYDVELLDIPALEMLLHRIGAITADALNESIALGDIRTVELTLSDLPATEREALISARLGQGLFRARLMSFWRGRCAVTSIAVSALLRASHIKPWRLSDNSERLDPENGLMLVANLDAAFDAGLVSFRDDGTMLFSPKLGPKPHNVLGIEPRSALTQRPSDRQQVFLAYHRNMANLV